MRKFFKMWLFTKKNHFTINGFSCHIVYEGEKSYACVRPLNSDRTFYFRDRKQLTDFCNSYQNIHSVHFWTKKYKPIYSKDFVLSF